MKKLVMISLISTLSALLIVGCAGETPVSKHQNEDAKTADYTPIADQYSVGKIHKKIVSAGEEAGWKMTEFKTNAVLAEKFSDDDAKAVTIYFSKDFFHLDPKNSELNSILKKALTSDSEH